MQRLRHLKVSHSKDRRRPGGPGDGPGALAARDPANTRWLRGKEILLKTQVCQSAGRLMANQDWIG